MSTKSKKFKFTSDKLDYTFKMKRRCWLWWLLLLLLIPLLFIRFNKTITVTCLEKVTEEKIAYTPASLQYTDYALYKDGKWFTSEKVSVKSRTDSTGKAVFEKLPCGVFGFIFHPFTQAKVTIEEECHSKEPQRFNFHYSCKKTLYFDARREDLQVKILDDETGDPLPGATLYYEQLSDDKVLKDSVKTDAAGIATLKQMKYCGMLSVMRGSCYGYADTTKMHVPCRDLLIPNDETALRLRPIKQRFTFFVKNKLTREPIPDAECQVTLTHPGASHSVSSRVVRTSIDGKGVAFYEDAFILSTIAIKASKPHYHDGVLEGGPWTVDKFIHQPDDVRTVWLEPMPYQREFQNIDSLSLRPIPGVTNTITVYHSDGTSDVYTEIGNSNGIFPITAMEHEKVHVKSVKTHEYLDKETDYPVFKDVTDNKIRMTPIFEELTFKTVLASDESVLLPDCTLSVNGSISGHLPPSNSGSGVFTVKMRVGEKLSIVATKTGYGTNDSKVRNADYAYLAADEYRRVIPLDIKLSPCDAGVDFKRDTGSGIRRHEQSYNMGQKGGTASLWFFFGDKIADEIYVYDGIGTGGPLIYHQITASEHTIPFSFNESAITVVIVSNTNDGTFWEYRVRCPR